MGLALCHTVPRDVVLQIGLVLFLAALVLQAVTLNSQNRATAAGSFVSKDGTDAVVGYIAGYPATYSGGASPRTKVCNPTAPLLRFHCARFAESYHTLNGLVLASFVSTSFAFFGGGFVIARISETTLVLLDRILMLATVPVSLQCAVLGIFFVRTVPNARLDLIEALSLTAPANELAFHRGHAANLMIAATALLCAAYLLIAVRWAMSRLTRLVLLSERRTGPTPNEVKVATTLHLANDDWARQMQILRSHARSVEVEINMKEENNRLRDTHSGDDDDVDVDEEDGDGRNGRGGEDGQPPPRHHHKRHRRQPHPPHEADANANRRADGVDAEEMAVRDGAPQNLHSVQLESTGAVFSDPGENEMGSMADTSRGHLYSDVAVSEPRKPRCLPAQDGATLERGAPFAKEVHEPLTK